MMLLDKHRNTIHQIFFSCTMPIMVLCILMYPTIFRLISDSPVPLSYVLVSLLFVLPITHLLSLVKNKVLFCLLLLIFVIVSVIETVMVVISDTFISAGNILAVVYTNSRESLGFVTNNLYVVWYLLPLIVIYIIVCVKCNRRKTIDMKLHLILLGITCILCGGYIMTKYFLQYKGIYPFKYMVERVMLSRVPYNFFMEGIKSNEYVIKREKIDKGLTFSYDAFRVDNPQQNEIYVLAIGESCRYENFSLNGSYDKQTMPCLSSLKDIYSFDNYYSTASLTMFSVPQIITRATAVDFERNYEEGSIVKAFTESGFKSYVIVCYNLLSYDTYLSRGAELIVVENDAEIPHKIDSIADLYPKVFFIAQFLGCHFPYMNYTEEFNKFHPNINDSGIEMITKEHYMNAYDNTVLYADYVLHSIINNIDRNHTISSMIFVGDHGEIIDDRGGIHGTSLNPLVEEYHTPCIIWCNSNWSSKYPTKKKALNSNIHKPMNADNIFYSVCDLGNISIPNDSIINRMSFFSSNFTPSRERFFLWIDGKSYNRLPDLAN